MGFLYIISKVSPAVAGLIEPVLYICAESHGVSLPINKKTAATILAAVYDVCFRFLSLCDVL